MSALVDLSGLVEYERAARGWDGTFPHPVEVFYLADDVRALLAAAPESLFDRKLANLEERGYAVIGRILHKDGQYALFDSSCRWLDKAQYQRLMHEQDGSLFAAPAPATPAGSGNTAVTFESEPLREKLEEYFQGLNFGTREMLGAIDVWQRAHTAQAVAAAEKRADNAEGMAECMRMFRDDMIRMGVITEKVAPMFMTEAISNAMGERLAAQKAEIESAAPQQHAQAALSDDEPSEIESVIACLGDDAARLQESEPEVADNMRAAERLLETLAAQVRQEQEACAAIADSVNNHDNPMTARDVADAIRARGASHQPAAAPAAQQGVSILPPIPSSCARLDKGSCGCTGYCAGYFSRQTAAQPEVKP